MNAIHTQKKNVYSEVLGLFFLFTLLKIVNIKNFTLNLATFYLVANDIYNYYFFFLFITKIVVDANHSKVDECYYNC